MEKPSCLKECPRCGLKKGRGPNQCDFCGWDFKESYDGRSENVCEPDSTDQDFKRLVGGRHIISETEADNIDSSETPAPLSREEDVLDIPFTVGRDELADEAAPLESANEATLPKYEKASALAAETYTAVEASTDVQTFEPSLNKMAIDATWPEQVSSIKSGQDVILLREDTGRLFSLPIVKTATMLIMGVALCIAALTLAPWLGRVLGWSIIIIGAFLIALSTSYIILSLRRKHAEDDIVLCPMCDETLPDGPWCPSCGNQVRRT